MNISYLSGAFIPSRAANSMHVMRMCQAFALQGHAVTLHSFEGDLDARDDHDFYGVLPVFEVVKQTRLQVRAVGAVLGALRTLNTFRARRRPDLIYARNPWDLLLLATQGIPFVFESHWRPSSSRRLVEAVLFRAPGFRRLVVISDELKKIYVTLFPWMPEESIIVAHDAADPPEDAPIVEGQGFEGSDGLQVGYVGSFQPGSGVGLITELARLMPDVDFHVVGGKRYQADEGHGEGGVPENLRFYGFVPPRELPALYSRLDVLLAPYQKETLSIGWASPMKLFEYMSHGKAIVCSDFPVIREILTNSENALLVRAESRSEWAEAIEKLGDEKLRRSLGERARSALLERHTWGARAVRVLAGIGC